MSSAEQPNSHGRTLFTGRVIDARYELERRIGIGGMGEVWRARQLRLPGHVAIKVLKRLDDAAPEALKRFRREAEVASRLNHPHIVKATDWGELEHGMPYLVLELLAGVALRERLGVGPLPLELVVEVAQQTASGLAAAHREGIVHRDLKPENVFLCDEGSGRVHVKVLDFGISKMHTAETHLTRDHAVFGTPHYMAPEQAEGKSSDVDARADQYALAVIVYEMLSGAPPFRDETRPLQLLYRVIHEAPPALAALRPELPVALVAAVERGMAKDPEARFRLVTDFADALARAAGMSRLATPGLAPTGPSAAEFAAMNTVSSADDQVAPAPGPFSSPSQMGATPSQRPADIPATMPSGSLPAQAPPQQRPHNAFAPLTGGDTPQPLPELAPPQGARDAASRQPRRAGSRRGALVVLLVAVLGGGAIGGYFAVRDRSRSRAVPATPAPGDKPAANASAARTGVNTAPRARSTKKAAARKKPASAAKQATPRPGRPTAKKPTTARKPATARAPPTARKTATAKKPTAGKKPAAAKKPATANKPSDKPARSAATGGGIISAAQRSSLAAARKLVGSRPLDAWVKANQVRRTLPPSQRWRAHAIQAMAMCSHSQLGRARDHWSKLPAAARRRVARVCRSKYDMDL